MVQVNYWDLATYSQTDVFGYINGQMEDFAITITEENPNELETLVKNEEIPTYISFDGNGIDLYKTNKRLYKSGDYVGYISSGVSDGYCYFESYKYSVVLSELSNYVRDFSKGITIQFYGNCCSEVKVQYQGVYGSHYEEYTVDDSLLSFVPSVDTSAYNSIIIYFQKSVLPNQLIKIAYIKFGTTKVFTKFKETNLLEEINVLSDDLPINSFNFTVVTDKDMSVSFKKKDKVAVYSNDNYYGTFEVTECQKIANGIYSVETLNCVNRLEKNKYSDWYYHRDILDNIVSIISNGTGVDVTLPEDDLQYCIVGHIPIETYRYLLCGAAFACCLMVDGSRSKGIRLVPVPEEITSIITTANKRIIGECTYTETTPVKTAYYTYVSKAVHRSTDENISIPCEYGETTTYYFDEPTYVYGSDFQPNVTVESTSYNYLVLTSKLASVDAVTVYTVPVLITEKEVAIENTVESEATSEKKYNNFKLRGNTVITPNAGYGLSDSNLSSLVNKKKQHILKYIQSGGTIKGKIRLRGERVGDLIQIETAFDGVKTGIITSMNISFGYEDVADIEVLEWSL